VEGWCVQSFDWWKKRKRKKKGQKTSFFTLKPNFVEGGHPQSLETKRFIQIRVEPPPTDFW